MRYLKVIGNGKDFVQHPFAINAEPRRFAGYQLRPVQPQQHCQLSERYMPREEVIGDEPSLRKAIKNNELTLLQDGIGESQDSIAWGLPTQPPPPPPGAKA